MHHTNGNFNGKVIPRYPSHPEKVPEASLTASLPCFPVAAWQVLAVALWQAVLPGLARHARKSERVEEGAQRPYELIFRPEVWDQP